MIDLAARVGPPREAKPGKPQRRDIQALRALAVLLVVVNHFWPDLLTGGYVGVDVFFVISGYLITQHLLGELDRTGRIRLAQFYARRARRLLPAALLVALLSLLVAAIYLPADRLMTIARETIASTLYVENWSLAAQSVDYSALNNQASTVQHYWSLSVEEQFYLLWPLLLIGVYVLAGRRRSPRSFMVAALAAIGTASFAFSIYLTYTSRSEAYFVTPTRVWEFAAGGLIAAAASTWFTDERFPARLRVAGTAQWTGLALIAASALAFDESTYFPGFLAAVPVAGTVMIIASGPRSPLWSPNTLLGVAPVQTLGNISYSLYLWHWPVIILLPSIIGRPLGASELLLAVLLSVVLAGVTKKYIEDPGRSRLLPGASPRRILGLTLVATLTVTAVCAGLIVAATVTQAAEARRLDALSGGDCFGAKSLSEVTCEEPFGPPVATNVGAGEAPWFTDEQCVAHPDPIVVGDEKLLTLCDFSDGRDDAETVWLIGDSHAEQWKAAILPLARENHWKVTISLLGGCPYVDVKRSAFMGSETTDGNVQRRCLEWSRSVSDRVLAAPPDTVFLSSFSVGEEIDDGSGRSQAEQYRAAFADRVVPWTARGTEVYVIRDTPLTLDRSTPECLDRNKESPLECANPKTQALPADPAADAAHALERPDIRVIDLSDRFCPDDTCYAVIGGLHVYFDRDHVARSYVRSLIPAFAERFAAVAP
ncbi:acyltransferase family protein [Arthrobacter sp. L77]|uniref:acyltransferase family protein n=1 Tax=Arthrobacter sp. L77 TaxID=1496689 RepID=UPI00068C035B|nr:acyltransferase family protein [Arthrobacter sp. L77]